MLVYLQKKVVIMLRFKKKASSRSSSKEKETLSDKRSSLLKRLFFSKFDKKRLTQAKRVQRSVASEERPLFEKSRFKEEIISSKYSSGDRPFFDISNAPFEFPAKYGDNKIVVMVRDPWWLYTYWEVRGEIEEKTREVIYKEGAKPVKSILRVYDVTDKAFNGNNANRYFDIELRDVASSWYIHVGEPNRVWCVEIGIVADNGKFYVIARSNIVKTPRFGPSDVLDEEWLIPDEDFWKLFGLSGGYGVGKSSMELRQLIEKHLKEQAWSGGMFSGMSSFGNIEKKKGLDRKSVV